MQLDIAGQLHETTAICLRTCLAVSSSAFQFQKSGQSKEVYMFRFLLTTALLLSVANSISSQPALAQASQQIVFSGTGLGAFTLGTTTKASPFGFWIWCEGASSNPYAGACNGAMYFYAFGITRPVDGSVSGSNQTFTMTVHSPGPTFRCTLTNAPPVTTGPTNTVNLSCTTPGALIGGGSSQHSVVRVTGP
jgi:hypothetical protein